MPTIDASEGLSGLLQWSEPLIFDRLFDGYRAIVGDFVLARALARRHGRVWRALIRGDLSEFELQRGALVASLDDCGVHLDCLADVDADIMSELLEVVMARYRHSRRTAKIYHLALIELAGRLAPTHAAA
jgi:hypothetical protein